MRCPDYTSFGTSTSVVHTVAKSNVTRSRSAVSNSPRRGGKKRCPQRGRPLPCLEAKQNVDPWVGAMRDAGTAAEMVCPGGEAAFVGAMVADSLQLGGRVHWHTAMLGRKSSLKALRATLYRHRATALRTTEFSQGVAPMGVLEL